MALYYSIDRTYSYCLLRVELLRKFRTNICWSITSSTISKWMSPSLMSAEKNSTSPFGKGILSRITPLLSFTDNLKWYRVFESLFDSGCQVGSRYAIYCPWRFCYALPLCQGSTPEICFDHHSHHYREVMTEIVKDFNKFRFMHWFGIGWEIFSIHECGWTHYFQ